ncbi:MAG: hypothetical protein R3C59_17480 [Planctomycetaceae bacterium]
MMTPQESMEIFWATDEGRVEVEGFYIAAVWSVTDASPGAEVDFGEWCEVRTSTSRDAGVHTLVVAVRVLVWPEPDAWQERIRALLETFTDRGAVIAWLYGEEGDSSLEELDGGNVIAAYSEETGLLSNVHLDHDLEYLNDEQCLRLVGVLTAHGIDLLSE